jgi:hypothetical protein
MYIKEVGWEGVDLIYLPQDRNQWWTAVVTVTNPVSIKCREFHG